MPNLSDQLASKQPNITSCTFPIGEVGEKAAKEYTDAVARLDLIKFLNAKRKPGEPKTDTKTAEAEVRKALQRYEKASVTLRFRGLTSTERDALASEFAPNEDEKIDAATYRKYTCALLALAALDSDLSADGWDAELYESGRWSAGEVEVIRDTARAAYEEVSAPGIPKG